LPTDNRLCHRFFDLLRLEIVTCCDFSVIFLDALLFDRDYEARAAFTALTYPF
jgi:hypothetical protein